jgi:hypothetical protein
MKRKTDCGRFRAGCWEECNLYIFLRGLLGYLRFGTFTYYMLYAVINCYNVGIWAQSAIRGFCSVFSKVGLTMCEAIHHSPCWRCNSNAANFGLKTLWDTLHDVIPVRELCTPDEFRNDSTFSLYSCFCLRTGNLYSICCHLVCNVERNTCWPRKCNTVEFDNVELNCHLAAAIVTTPCYFKYFLRDGAEVNFCSALVKLRHSYGSRRYENNVLPTFLKDSWIFTEELTERSLPVLMLSMSS